MLDANNHYRILMGELLRVEFLGFSHFFPWIIGHQAQSAHRALAGLGALDSRIYVIGGMFVTHEGKLSLCVSD